MSDNEKKRKKSKERRQSVRSSDLAKKVLEEMKAQEDKLRKKKNDEKGVGDK